MIDVISSFNNNKKIIVYFDLLGFDEQARHFENITALPSEIFREKLMDTFNCIIRKKFPTVIYKQTSLDGWVFLFEDLNSSFIVLNDLKKILENEYSLMTYESCIISSDINTRKYYLTDATMTAVKTCNKYRRVFKENSKQSIKNSFILLHKDAYPFLNQRQKDVLYNISKDKRGFFGYDDATLIEPQDYIVGKRIKNVTKLKRSVVIKENIEYIETDFLNDTFYQEHISNSKKINLYSYTGETFVVENQEILKKHPHITLKILIRNPFKDRKKKKQALDSINLLNDISVENKKFKFFIRFYDHSPLLRATIFDEKEGFLGMYRYDPKRQYKFYGVEENILLHVKDDNDLGKMLLKLYLGRFKYDWINSHPIEDIIK